MPPAGGSGGQRAALILIGLLLLAPAVPLPRTEQWEEVRAYTVMAAGLAGLLLLAARGRRTVAALPGMLRSGPHFFLLAYLAWAALSAALAAPTWGTGGEVARAELLRLAGGGVVFWAVSVLCDSRDALRTAALVLLAAGILAAAAGYISFSSAEGVVVATGAYRNSQLLAANLALLLPFACAYVAPGRAEGRHLLGAVAAVLLLAGLVMARDRSTWIASIPGVLLAALLTRGSAPRRAVAGRHHLVIPVVMLLAVVGLASYLAANDPGFQNKFGRLMRASEDRSLHWRLNFWAAGGELAYAVPLTGRGLGTFPLAIGEYNYRVPDRVAVEEIGVTLSSLPHNEYVQVLGELGLVGLALFLAAPFALLYEGLRRARSLRSDLRRRTLAGALGATLAMLISSFSNPGWHFAEVSVAAWAILGLGAAALGTDSAA